MTNPITGRGSSDEPSVDWEDPTTKIVFDEAGWAIQACEGSAPLLCVERRRHHAGGVEAAAYALEDFDGLHPAAAPANDENGCPGRDELSGFHLAELTEFRRYLEEVLQVSPLPPVSA